MPEPFFHPLEVTPDGKPAFREQVEYLKSRLSVRSQPLYDLVFFVHGWNKSPFLPKRTIRTFSAGCTHALRASSLTKRRPMASWWWDILAFNNRE